MKSTIISLLLLICCSAIGQTLRPESGIPFFNDRSEHILLDGTWRFNLYQQGEDIPQDFNAAEFNDEGWMDIQVPGCWDALGLVKPKYVAPKQMEGLYRTLFNIPSEWKGSHVFLRFDGVLRGYEVWINGQYAGKWESAYNSCQFDITPFISTGENLLAMRVYTEYKGTGFDSNDDWGQVGINRSVSVFPVPDFHISGLRVNTTEVSEASAKVSIDMSLASFSGKGKKRVPVSIDVLDPSGKQVYGFNEKFIPDSICMNQDFVLENPQLWTAETPDLYTLTIKIGNEVAESMKFGVREVTVRKEKLLLNGKPIKLRGVNHHDSDPYHGKVISRESLIKDMEMMKEANMNFIRCSHYPKTPEFYELCDSMGFYVMDEIPFGFGEEHLKDPDYLEVLINRAHATIIRDWNHPSVIIWSVGNENELTDICKKTGQFVKDMDPYRPICYPMIHNYFLSIDFDIPKFVDIFAPHYPTVATLRYYAEASKRPVILTEYCHTLGQSLEQHDELWEIIESNDNLAGGAIWEWADQGMVNFEGRYPGKFGYTEDLWKKDSTCIIMSGNAGTDGLLYADRTPLSNYYEVKKNYAQAKLLTDSLTGRKGENQFTLSFLNRYDFVDLAGTVSFEWALLDGTRQLSGGEFSLSCRPSETCSYAMAASLPECPSKRCYIMKVNVIDKDGRNIGNYSLPVMTPEGESMRFISALTDAAAVKDGNIDGISKHTASDLMLRAGRKKGLSERIKAKNSLNRYLLTPDWKEAGEVGQTVTRKVEYSNSEFSAQGEIGFTQLENGGIRVEASVRPEKKDILLLEGGYALLLDKNIRYFQWIGNGPYSSYPGKASANSFGIHSMEAGDLYFEGNRMGIDAMICMDRDGKGLMFISEGCSMNLEETDKGVVVSLNSIVAGYCGKLRETAFPVNAEDVESIDMTFTVLPFEYGKCPDIDFTMFKTAKEINAENPYLTMYDTYLMPMDSIVEEKR